MLLSPSWWFKLSFLPNKRFFLKGQKMSDQYGCLNLLNISDNDPSICDISVYIYLQT